MADRPPVAGECAPQFELHAHPESVVSLAGLRGRTVVLYFYPKADTPGCTTEACDFRDRADDFVGAGAVVLACSPDPVRKLARFAAKHELPFTLLSDPDHAVASAYGVWKEKTFMGRKYMGVERSTFVIGPDGVVLQAYANVRAAGHAEAVLQAVTDDGAGG